MNNKIVSSTIAALLALSSMSFAVDAFARQPNIKGAYNKLLAALSHLEKSKLEDAKKQIDDAIVDLDAAKTLLEQATNNKGTYRGTAIKLCDEAKDALTATPPDVVKATEMANHALKEVNEAGHAGAHKH
jgi:hypothetical protein